LTELLLCLLALLCGPLLYQLARARRNTYAFFDGFVLVAVGGIVLIEILPGKFQALGIIALPVAIAGFIFPHALEHWLDSLPVSPRTILSGLIVAGLIIHQLLDGAALRSGDEALGLSALAMAVILHQLPKGFLLWDIARKAKGAAAAALVVLGLAAATTAGFALGGPAMAALDSTSLHHFQAFVAGGLLHVVLHHVSVGAEGRPGSAPALWSGIGAILATVAFALLPEAHFVEPVPEGGLGFRSTFARLFLESAPPILLGLAIAGVVQAFVPSGNLRWFHGRSRLSEALRGIALGLPLPICSCGVTPLYHTLVRRGVPAAAAVSFLIATPEIGVDSFLLSARLLGWKVTLIRLAMAGVIAVLSGVILSRVLGKVQPVPDLPMEPLKESPATLSFGEKARSSIRFGFGELVDHVGVWLIAGIAVAAAVEPYLDEDWFAALPPGLDVVLLALLGLPVYVCASGATPLAATLVGKGVSVGAVLAFLITGPTTNVTTLGVLGKLHGFARAASLPAIVFALSVLLGWGVNLMLGPGGSTGVPGVPEEHGPFETACAVVLALMLFGSLLRLGPRRFIGKLASDTGLGHSHPEGPGHESGGEEGCGCHTAEPAAEAETVQPAAGAQRSQSSESGVGSNQA